MHACRRWAALALFLFFSIGAGSGLVACGGDDSSSGSSGSPTSTTTPPPPPPVGNPPPVNPPGEADGGADSGMDGGGTNKAATPTCSPASGTYTTTTNVTLTTTSPGADVYFTTDGTNPTTASVVYATPLPIAMTTTIRAMAGKPGTYVNSDVVECKYTITVPGGTVSGVDFNPKPGTFPNLVSVWMSSATPGATICFTADGSAPACNAATGACTGTSATYSAASPFPVSTTGTTLKAIACLAGSTPSAISSATYSYAAAVPVATPGDPAATTSLVAGGSPVQLATATNGGAIHYTTDGSTPTCGSGFVITDTGFVNPNVTQNTTIKALTCKTGFAPSAVQTFVYTVMTDDRTLTLSPALPSGGPYINDQTSSFSGFACYETNNAKPDPTCNAAGTGCTNGTASGAANAGPTIAADATNVRWIGCSAGHAPSNRGSMLVNLKAAKVAIHFDAPAVALTPNSDLDATDYDSNPSSSDGTADFSTATAGAKIRYTLNGASPTPCALAATANDHESIAPISGVTIPNPSPIRAIACKTGYQQSDEHAATFASSGNQVTFQVVAGGTVTEAPATGADPFAMTIANLTPANAIVCYVDGPQTSPDCDAAGTMCTAGTAYDPANPPLLANDGAYFSARACANGLGKSFIHQFQYRVQARVPTASPMPTETPLALGTVVTFDESTTTTGWNPTTDATPGVPTASPIFHYTVSTNGAPPSDPTCATPATGTSFLLKQNPTWLKVIACKASHAASAVLDTGMYTVTSIGAPTFSPAGPSVPEVQNVHVGTVSAGVQNAVICYTTGSAPGVSGGDPATDPQCSSNFAGCTTGSIAPASTGVDIAINPGAGNHTFVKAVTCGGVAGVGSGVTTQDFSLRPSDVVFTPDTTSGFTSNASVAITLAQPPNCYGAGSCPGASPTVSPTICYTTDNSTPTYDPTTCTASATTTCTQTSEVDLVFDQTTALKAASCKPGFFAGTLKQATYTFVEYSRAITADVANMSGSATPWPGDGKFYDPENSIGTSNGGYSFWFSYATTPGLISNPTSAWWGLRGLDLSVDNTTHVTSLYNAYPDYALPTTTTPNTAMSQSAATLPTPVSQHIACVNSAVSDVVTCSLFQWNGAAWVPQGGSSPTFSRDTASGQLLIGFGFAPVRRFVTFGAINVSGTDTIGFPGPGIYTHWLDVELESYRVPSDPTFKH